jgi:molybdate transport system substrate-binding protein
LTDHSENYSFQILSAGAPRAGVLACIERHGGAAVEFATAPQIAERLAGGAPGKDLLIAPLALLQQARGDGLLSEHESVVLGTIRAGIVVNSTAPVLTIDTPEKLRAALLGARRIIFNRASSGRHIEQLLEQLDIAVRVAGRVVRTDTGGGVIEALAADTAGADIGFAQSTEIRRLAGQGESVRLAGLIPDVLARSTTYAAAILRRSERQPAAQEFLAFLAAPPAHALLDAAGIAAADDNHPNNPL